MLKLMQQVMLILVSVLVMGAASGSWKRLGRLDVGLPADHDALSVPHNVGPLRELKIEAQHGSIEIRDVVITFDDGTTIKPGFGSRLSERSKGQVVALPGKRRRVRQIDFTYAPAHNKQRVQLLVYGR